jgi:type IV secretion system protein VirB8
MSGTEQPLAGYYAEARSWESDRLTHAQILGRRGWWVAAAGWVAAVACGIALASLAPLKRTEPFLIRVDNTTGVVDVVPPYRGEATAEETLTRFLLTHYTQVCERFTLATAESDYEECGAFNSSERNQRWSAEWSTGNPTSPLNRYKDGTTVRAQVQAVSFFTRANGLKDLAQVRYLKGERPGGEGGERLTQWIATIQYAYGEPSADPRRRLLNPLGFRILEFKIEPEVLAPSVPSAVAPTTVAGNVP